MVSSTVPNRLYRSAKVLVQKRHYVGETLEDLGTMLDGLSRASQQVGLKMNIEKTKIMSNVRVAPTPVKVGDSALEVVDEYVYVGQKVQLGKSNFEKEVNRRIQLGWAAFGKLRDRQTRRRREDHGHVIHLVSISNLSI